MTAGMLVRVVVDCWLKHREGNATKETFGEGEIKNFDADSLLSGSQSHWSSSPLLVILGMDSHHGCQQLDCLLLLVVCFWLAVNGSRRRALLLLLHVLWLPAAGC